MVVARGCGREFVFNGYSVSVWEEDGLEMDGGDGYTTL